MEYLDIIDENNVLTGEKEERNVIHEKGIWHREVCIWIVNEKGEVLLQKRAANKKQEPNKWSTCAGHIDAGESVEFAVVRELEEEIGLKTSINELEFIGIEKKQIKLPNNLNNYNFQYMYFIKTNMKIEDFKIQIEELSELKYIAFNEFEDMVINKDPNSTFSNKEYMPKIVNEIRNRIILNQLKC